MQSLPLQAGLSRHRVCPESAEGAISQATANSPIIANVVVNVQYFLMSFGDHPWSMLNYLGTLDPNGSYHLRVMDGRRCVEELFYWSPSR